MYTHFAPPSAVLREKESLAGRVGEDAPAVRKFTRSERYESEVKVMHRCLSLALIKHALGDYFSLEFPWPHPSVDTEPYKELVKQPGVFIVTADVAQEGQSPAGDSQGQPSYHMRRFQLITNIPMAGATQSGFPKSGEVSDAEL